MVLNDEMEVLNTKIEKNKAYQFILRHERVIKIIEGLVIILVLISLNSFLFRDHAVKKEIATNCGWEAKEDYYCICDKSFVKAGEIKLSDLEGLGGIVLTNVTLDK